MADNELKISITADSEGVKTGAQAGAQSFAQACDQIKDSIAGLNGAISSLTGLLAGALSIGAMKSAIDAATSYNASIISLSRVMGIGTEQASVLSTAIKIIGGTTEEYAAINMRLGMHIKTNADALEQLGVVLKDSNGDLLSQSEIFDNAIKAMAEYKEGADRNQFALYAFGRGAAEVYKYLNLTQDTMRLATDVANRYGLVIGDQAAQQTKQMSYQLNILGIVFDAIKVQIGNEMLPTIVNLAGEFGDLAATTLPYLMGAIKAFMTVFEGFAFSVKSAGAIIVGVLFSIGSIVQSVAVAVMRIAKGDFQGAWQAMKDGASEVKVNMQATWDSVVANAEATSKRLEAIWLGSSEKIEAAQGMGKGTKTFVAPEKDKKEAAEKSRVSEWRDELEQQKMDEKAYFDFSIDREKAFWAEKLTLTKAGTKERFEVNHAIFELEKKDAQEQIRDAEKQIDTEMKLAEKSTAAKQKELDGKYKLGEISAKEQIAGEISLANQLYATQTEELSKYEALAEKYPQIWQQVQDKIKLITEKHNDDINALNLKLQLETKKTYDTLFAPIQSAIDTSVKGMIMGTTTMQKAIQNLGTSIVASFVDLGTKEVLEWTKKEVMKLNVSQMFSDLMVALGIKTATETADAKAGIEIPAAETEIETSAATAAAGAASSQAGIPYIGPALAIAAAAAMMALVLGFKSKISAAGGYDIPAGVNPLAQLHAQEMVLPADLAGGLRSMIGRGGGGGATNITIQALDTKSFFSREGRKVLKGLAGPARSMGIRV